MGDRTDDPTSVTRHFADGHSEEHKGRRAESEVGKLSVAEGDARGLPRWRARHTSAAEEIVAPEPDGHVIVIKPGESGVDDGKRAAGERATTPGAPRQHDYSAVNLTIVDPPQTARAAEPAHPGSAVPDRPASPRGAAQPVDPADPVERPHAPAGQTITEAVPDRAALNQEARERARELSQHRAIGRGGPEL